MTLGPIINSKIEDFKEEFILNGSEDEIFEKYVNYQILKRRYPDFASDMSLFDKVCVGGGCDMGMDGIIISINDQPISSIEEAKDIMDNRSKVTIEISFIQSKNQSSFKQKDFAVFKDGIENFLEKNTVDSANEKVRNWCGVLEEISKRDNLKKWKKEPDIYAYYVTTGSWQEQSHIVSAIDLLKKHISERKTYNVAQVFCIDAKRLIKIIDENEEDYTTTIKVEQKIGLPRVDRVDSSSVYLCKAINLMELLTTEEKILRRDLFEDNVRDFQGYTNINNDVKETIVNKPDQFLLLNNGITIVCRKMNDPNMELTVEAPQIVNGCQTCNILYDCYKDKENLDNVFVILKVISSEDGEIVNNVVKGTNKQNIVYEEALETTRNYHKFLESFFLSFDKMDNYPKLYYERRAKQYRNYKVKANQKVNLRMITQGFVAVFLNRPDQGIHHELTLLKTYKTRLFQENSSFYPYYTAAFLYKNIDNFFREEILPKRLKSYVLHITFITKEIIMSSENMPKQFNSKAMEAYCIELLTKIENRAQLLDYSKRACDKFEEITEKWVAKKGENFRSGRKDSEEFTRYILDNVNTEEIYFPYVGKIIKVGSDKNGNTYGFIESEPENIFFHAANNNESVTSEFENRMITYEMGEDKRGEPTPVNIQLID